MAKCIATLKVCQDEDERLDYGFNWTREFSRRWKADFAFDTGITIRPESEPTGLEYVSSGGQTGAEEPNWPTTIGGTVTDGSITWTAQVLSSDSLIHEIATDAWSDSIPAGLTVEGQLPVTVPGAQMTQVILSGGSSGITYTVENEVTTASGLEYIAQIILKIE